MAIEQINPGAAPLLWSTVDDAFKKINDNFTELALSVGLGNVVDLTALASTIAPIDDNTHDLGKLDSRWRDLYLDQFIYLGGARVGSAGNVVNLPAGSTIGDSGQLLDESYFKIIRVPGQDDVIADNGIDILTLTSGIGVGITTADSTDTITFTNTGVTSISTGTGISINSSTGAVAVTNTGVTTLTGTAGQIGISASTGSVVLTNLGVIQLTTDPGSGIGLSATSGSINISNLAPNIAQNVFRFISIPGQDIIEADTIADTLTLTPGYGITLTATALTDTVTIELNQNIDINGSVFADDSSAMVDAVDQKMFAAGGFFGNLTGNVTGNVIGNAASATVSTTLDITDTNGLTTVFYPTFVENRTTGQPVRADVDLSYRTDTNTLTVPNIAGNIFTNLIDSADSSAITVTPATIFSADIIVENDIQLSNINASIRGTDKIKFVPSNADEFSDNIRLEITSDNSFQPSLSIDTPSGVDLTLSSGLAGIGISKINSRVTLGAGDNTFIVKANGSWVMSLLSEEPLSLQIGVYIANGTTWDPASKGTGRPYPVWYDGVVFNALY